MKTNNEKIMDELYEFWTFTIFGNGGINTHRFIKYLIKIFWPDLYSRLEELSLSIESKNMLRESILEPIIFENSHLSIGMSTSQYVCPSCNRNVNMKIINEYVFNKD